MSEPMRASWTQEAFFAWDGHSDARYEFDGVQPVAMVGGTLRHARIIGNLHFALRRRLIDGPCSFPGPDAGLMTINRAVRYPDALVACGPTDDDANTVSNAVVVFEVLSPGSGRTDRIEKVREYAAVPSIRRYVILEYRSAALTMLEHASTDEPWRTTTLLAGDVLHMPEINISVPVAEFYDRVEFASI